MKRSRTTIYLLTTDWMILVGSFAVALHYRRFSPELNIISPSHLIPEMSLVFMYGLVMLGVFSALSLYKRKVQLSPLIHFVAIVKATAITVMIYMLAKSLSKSDLLIPSRLVLLQWGFLLLFVLTVHRLVVVRLLFRLLSKTDLRRRVIVIGDTDVANQFIKECINNVDSSMLVIGVMEDAERAVVVKSVPFLGIPATLPEVIALYNLEGAVICNPALTHQELINLVEQCVRLFGWVDIHSDQYSTLQGSGSGDAYFDIPFVRMHGIPNSQLYKAYKRTFDCVVSFCGLLLLSPLLIITAIAIKRSSPGPVFYIKERVGKDGKPFLFYKFRSMAQGADQDETRNDQIRNFIQNHEQDEATKTSKIVNTAYVTPVGKFIRRWAIDELPQLLNVLKGDMALVGPRPVPQAEYEHEDDWHRRRFAIEPGCTGLWKLHATQTGVTFNDSVLYDIFYSRNMNPALDLMIILGTIWIIISGKADG